jgi:deoxyadenosine/deoxycytidine kinase
MNGKYSVMIEGNIASGKSTVIKILEEKLGQNATVFSEPLHEWTNFCGENLLQKMYDNPKENAFLFQTYVQYTMSKIQFEEVSKAIKITERSLHSERHVFVEGIKILNYISQIQYEVLVAWFNLLAEKVPPVDEVIYLRTSPLVAFGRLQDRNRTEETSVSKEYLALLHSLHENWLINETFGKLPFKLTVINQDQTLKELEPEFDLITKRLLEQTNHGSSIC